ncbi:phospholipase D family protein [Endozoicomonas elysicola]|nr:phospholipase D family protein [Endozoicomonas elysicola]
MLKVLMVSLLTFNLIACASLPSDSLAKPSNALETVSAKATRIGLWVENDNTNQPGLSGFHPLSDGLDALVARLALIEAADKTIDAQYYLYHDDLVGQLFLQYLLRAADRGVRVRLLLDDLSIASLDKTVAIANEHPFFEIRLFNPLATRGWGRSFQLLAQFDRANRRMHNKSFIVDNQLAILGGRNIGNEYYRNSAVEFADLDMIHRGVVVPQISNEFDRYWNSSSSYPAESLINRSVTTDDKQRLNDKLADAANSASGQKYIKRLKQASLVEHIASGEMRWYWGDVSVYADAPEKILAPVSDRSTHLTPQLFPYIDSAARELVMFSPYLVPGKEGVTFFSDLVKRGVKVVLITNSLASTDVAVVHAGYSKYRKDLLEAGVRLIEVKPHAAKGEIHKTITGSSRASLHAKTFIIDRRYLFVGSLNLDPRSALLNTEIGAIYDTPEMAEDFISGLSRLDRGGFWELKLTENGIQWFDCNPECRVVSNKDPESSLFTRVGIFILSLLPIEQQL